MIYVFVAVLLLIVILFGVSSGMQSYATAQQAQAQIEAAKVAQVNAWGNVISILTFVAILFVVLLLIAAVIWLLYKRSQQRATPSVSTATPSLPSNPSPAFSTDDLMKILIVQSLRSLQPPAAPPSLPTPREEQDASNDEPLYWLRQ